MQGFFGASTFDHFERTGGSGPDVEASSSSTQMPVIGGGGQWKLGGKELDFGLELMFSFSGRANATAFAFGGSGATIAVSIDMLVFELYGGPFVSCFLGDSARVYASAGPLMEWVDYDEQIPGTTTHTSGDGFGTGVYARTGIEFALDDSMMLGLGARWSNSTVDLGYGLGDLDVDGFQFVLTITEGF
jgi:opacity protein-like surface antigen